MLLYDIRITELSDARARSTFLVGNVWWVPVGLVEYARNVAGSPGGGHAETEPEAEAEELVVARLVEHGVIVSANAEEAGVEGIELPDHPFFLATLFQPQMAAAHDEGLHPLIRALIEAGS